MFIHEQFEGSLITKTGCLTQILEGSFYIDIEEVIEIVDRTFYQI